MTTKTALIIVGVAVAAMAVFYAFRAHPTAVANSNALKASEPPPQPIGSTLLTTRASSVSSILGGNGAFGVNGSRQFLR